MAINKFNLSAEEIAKLESMAADISVLEGEIAKLDRLGIDTAKMKAQLAASKTLKDNLLEEFSNN